MPTRRDNDVERLARLEALMEEYRVKGEDVRQQIDELRQQTARTERQAKAVRLSARRTRERRKKA